MPTFVINRIIIFQRLALMKNDFFENIFQRLALMKNEQRWKTTGNLK
jgi:hypothetical protein